MNLHKIRAVSQHLCHGVARAMRFSLRENRAKAIRLGSHLAWSRFGRTAKVAAVSAAMVLGLASCTLDYTVGYVYVTTN